MKCFNDLGRLVKHSMAYALHLYIQASERNTGNDKVAGM